MRKAFYIIGFLMIFNFSFSSGFQLGISPSLKLPADEDVRGVQLSLFGKNRSTSGFNFNILGHETDHFSGLQTGIFFGASPINKINKSYSGATLGLANILGGEDDKGLLVGAYNATNNFKGLKMGVFNYAKGHSSFDFGAVNNSGSTNFQLGLLNFTKILNGAQIGLLNFSKKGGFRVMPGINASLRF